MRLLLKSAATTLGHAETHDARTDPPMGCGEVTFHPSAHYSLVERYFREKSEHIGILGPRNEVKLAAADEGLLSLNLSLVTESGEAVQVAGFTVSDYRTELPEEPLTLEFYGMASEQFERLFPGHYERYEASFASKA